MLPRVLIPQRKTPSKPPIMHYGWPIESKLDYLAEYAAKHDLTVYNTDFTNVSDDDFDDDFDFDDESQYVKTINEFDSAAAGLWHIVKAFGGNPDRVIIGPTTQLGNMIVLSIYTNCTLRHAPTEAFTKALCEELNLTEEMVP